MPRSIRAPAASASASRTTARRGRRSSRSTRRARPERSPRAIGAPRRLADRGARSTTLSRRRSATAPGATPWPIRARSSPAARSRGQIAGGAGAGRLADRRDARAAAADRSSSPRSIARARRGSSPSGSGADLVTARELALKIEEGARIAATALHLESLLHGHLAGCDAGTTALVLLAADSRGPRAARRPAGGRPRRAAAIGIPTVAHRRGGGAGRAPGRRRAPSRCPPAGTVAGTPCSTGAVALQLLTLELAHLVGSNPDLIRREQRAYREAAAVAETRADW